MSLTAVSASASASAPASASRSWAPFRVLIVDDEPLARQRLRSHLDAHTDFEVVAESGSGAEAVDLIRNLRPDLVFLDVEMPDRTGPEVWRDLQISPAPALVFVTAHANFAVQGFDLQATDYLLKPYNRDRFAAALARARNQLRAGREAAAPAAATAAAPRLVLKRDGEFHFIPPNEIVRVEAQGDFVKVHTLGGVHLVRQTLTRLQGQLTAPSFLRIHRSHLINRAHLTKVSVCADGDYSATVTGGAVVPVARAQTDVVRQLLD
jgi:two-component system LytT family response regulator